MGAMTAPAGPAHDDAKSPAAIAIFMMEEAMVIPGIPSDQASGWFAGGRISRKAIDDPKIGILIDKKIR